MRLSYKIAGAAAALGLMTATTACSSEASGDEVTLIVSSMLTEDHPASRAFDTWMEEVTERTDGRITFETYFNGSLCAAAEALNCAASGTADITFSAIGVHPELVITNIGNVPFVTNDLQANQDALNRLYQESDEFQAEFEEGHNQHLLYIHNNTAPILASKPELADLDAIEGLKVRAGGSMITAINALGANPVAIDLAEIYEGIERNVVDAVAFPLESFVDYRLMEVAENVYDLGEYIGSYATNAYSINSDTWAGLGEETQQILTEVSEEIAGTYVADYLEPVMVENCAVLAEEGIEIREIGPEDAGLEYRETAGATAREAWIESAAGVVEDPAGFFDTYVEYVEEASTGSSLTAFGTCHGAA